MTWGRLQPFGLKRCPKLAGRRQLRHHPFRIAKSWSRLTNFSDKRSCSHLYLATLGKEGQGVLRLPMDSNVTLKQFQEIFVTGIIEDGKSTAILWVESGRQNPFHVESKLTEKGVDSQ
jgi:hypothetical protein